MTAIGRAGNVATPCRPALPGTRESMGDVDGLARLLVVLVLAGVVALAVAAWIWR